jgi:hypothetical protein
MTVKILKAALAASLALAALATVAHAGNPAIDAASQACQDEYNVLFDKKIVPVLGNDLFGEVARVRFSNGATGKEADQAVAKLITSWIGNGTIDGVAMIEAGTSAMVESLGQPGCQNEADRLVLMRAYTETQDYLKLYGPALKTLYKGGSAPAVAKP